MNRSLKNRERLYCKLSFNPQSKPEKQRCLPPMLQIKEVGWTDEETCSKSCNWWLADLTHTPTQLFLIPNSVPFRHFLLSFINYKCINSSTTCSSTNFTLNVEFIIKGVLVFRKLHVWVKWGANSEMKVGLVQEIKQSSLW